MRLPPWVVHQAWTLCGEESCEKALVSAAYYVQIKHRQFTNTGQGEHKGMRYEKPETAKEAAGLLAKEKGASLFIGGGTDFS